MNTIHGEDIQSGTRILGRQLARELTLDEMSAVGGGMRPQCPHGTTGSDILGSRSDGDCSSG